MDAGESDDENCVSIIVVIVTVIIIIIMFLRVARIFSGTWDFLEALVEWQIMPDRILKLSKNKFEFFWKYSVKCIKLTMIWTYD